MIAITLELVALSIGVFLVLTLEHVYYLLIDITFTLKKTKLDMLEIYNTLILLPTLV